jgi:hypothetical protein
MQFRQYEKFFTIFFAFANPPIPFKAENGSRGDAAGLMI